MDVIIRNDLFASYAGLIDRVMRANHRMLCSLSMEAEDIYQELSLAVLHALDSYEEQRATTMDAHVWMTLQCALADLKQGHDRTDKLSGSTCVQRRGQPSPTSSLTEVLSNDRLWQALSRLDPREREHVLEYLDGQPAASHADARRCLASAKEKLRDFYLSIHVVSL